MKNNAWQRHLRNGVIARQSTSSKVQSRFGRIIGLVKALFWPAMLIYKLLEYLKM